MGDNKSELTMKEYTPWEKHHDIIFFDWADKAVTIEDSVAIG